MSKSKYPYKYGCFAMVYRVRFVAARNLAHDDEKSFIKNRGKKQVDETN